MTTQKLKTDVVTPVFRVSYPSVFKPSLNRLSQKMEFGLEALFPKDADLSALKAAAQNAMEAKFGADKSKWPIVTRSPFRDQKEKIKDGVLPDGYVSGAIFMRFKSERKPGVVDQGGAGVKPQEIIEESKFYAGCYARAHVNAFAFQKGANVGVSFGLNHVQFVKDGDPFSGRPRVEDAFSAVEGAGDGGDATNLFN
jgi:hypothetical protein